MFSFQIHFEFPKEVGNASVTSFGKKEGKEQLKGPQDSYTNPNEFVKVPLQDNHPTIMDLNHPMDFHTL
jgi:hypothetical protein